MKGYNKMRRKKQKRSDWALGGQGVKVLNNDVELALKRFKKMIKDSKKLVELSERRFYTKPSVKKRLERKMAKVRERKRLQESQ
jgi:small subunit ribosomal protein S21|tara:strand:- start:326 stop:577 length:252 start_codon:yes stop_codon:yes gene_type:complete